jgi:hypothetical protein
VLYQPYWHHPYDSTHSSAHKNILLQTASPDRRSAGLANCQQVCQQSRTTQFSTRRPTPAPTVNTAVHSIRKYSVAPHLSLPPEGVAHAVGPVVEALGGADQQVPGVEVHISLQNKVCGYTSVIAEIAFLQAYKLNRLNTGMKHAGSDRDDKEVKHGS